MLIHHESKLMPFFAMSTCGNTCAVSVLMNARKTVEAKIVCFDELSSFAIEEAFKF